MIVYAIRQKSTGLFLPCKRHNRKQRITGFTHDVPASGIPRLFSKRHYAQNALDYWLKGELYEVVTSSFSYVGEDDSSSELKVIQPAIPRVKEDMQIVSLQLAGEYLD